MGTAGFGICPRTFETDFIYALSKFPSSIIGLKSRTNTGRPNWNKVFTQLRQQNKGKITVFYCGNPVVGKILRLKCEEFGFAFKKEVF